MPKKSYYAVANGRETGIFRDWDSCKDQVNGYKNSSYKAFSSEAEAQAFVNANRASEPRSSSYSSYGGSSYSPEPETSYTSYSPSIPTYTPRHKSSYGSGGGGSSSKSSSASTSKPSSSYGSYSATTSQPSYSKSSSSSSSSSGSKKQVRAEPSGSTKQVRAAPSSESHYQHAPSPKRRQSSTETTSRQAATSWGDELTVVYTDGACSKNGTVSAQAGVGVYFGQDDPRNVSEPLHGPSQTNQRAELQAALRAMQQAKHNEPIEIRSDSRYLVEGMNSWVHSWDKSQKWGTVENRDLFEALHTTRNSRADRGVPTSFVHVKAHSGIPGNEAADSLAVSGASKRRK